MDNEPEYLEIPAFLRRDASEECEQKQRLLDRLIMPEPKEVPPACAYCDQEIIGDQDWRWLSNYKYRTAHVSCYLSAQKA